MKTAKRIGRMFWQGSTAIKVFSMADIGKAIGKTNEYVWRQVNVRKIWPEPTVLVGNKMFYDELVFANIVKDYKSSNE